MTINEVLEALTPENARFVSGQDLFLYVPKAQTNKRYGLAKYSPDDFSIDSNGVLTLLLPKSQIEDYFTEVYGGTRNETVLADPAINLLNLDKTDKDLYTNITRLDGRINSEKSRVDSLNLEIYGASGREGTVLNDINLTTLNATDLELKNKDIELQKNIDDIIQDDQPSSALNSTYSSSKITQLIKDAKMEGLHFVGFIGSEVGKDYNGEILIKEGALWHVSNETTSPTITDEWSADTMYKCVGGEWVKTTAYTPKDFDIWKNVNIPDSQINSWWYFEGIFEILDFTVDMNLYYTKVESDARYYTKTDADSRYYTKSVSDERFKSNFSYGNYLSETDSVLNIDTETLPTKGSLTSFVKGQSDLDVDNVESAIKLLETNVNAKFFVIDNRSRIIDKSIEPIRANDYAVDENGVYISQESTETPGKFEWIFKTKDLTTLLPRLNADRYIVKGINFTNDSSTGYLSSSLSTINLNTEEENSASFEIPVATNASDGIMPATAMRAISELDIRVTALQSGVQSYFVDFGSDSPSQEALTLLYQDISGKTETPPNLTRLIDASRNSYYEYYTSLEVHWQGPYVYRYGVATLSQIGLVGSSEQKGEIYVEPVTGVMSLNGYNDIISTFNTLYGGTDRTAIDVSQVPSIPTSKITSGTLDVARLPIIPISKGGTNNNTFSAYKLVVTGNVDSTTSTPVSLVDGPSFGALNTILVGQGANQLPVFKSREDAGLELVSRKITSWGTPTDTQYPSAKLVHDSLNDLQNDPAIIFAESERQKSITDGAITHNNDAPVTFAESERQKSITDGAITHNGDASVVFAESERQKSKNLFNINNGIYKGALTTSGGLATADNVSFSIDNETITLTTDTYDWRGIHSEYFKLKGNTVYTLSYSRSDVVAFLFCFYDSSYTFINSVYEQGNTQKTFTVPTNTAYVRFGIQNISVGTVTISNIQLEEGSVATDYQPYNGQITHNGDAPVVFAEDERQKSKNLLPVSNVSSSSVFSVADDGLITFNGEVGAWGYAIFEGSIYLKAGQPYTLSIQSYTGSGKNLLTTRAKKVSDGTIIPDYLYTYENRATITPTEDVIIDVAQFYFSHSGTVNFSCYVQIEEGSVATEYQPYNGAITHNGDASVTFAESERQKTLNLLRITQSISSEIVSGVTITTDLKNQTITLNGTPTGYSEKSINISNLILKANKKYSVVAKTVSGSVSYTSGTDFYINLNNVSTWSSYFKNLPQDVTFTTDTEIWKILLSYNDKVTFNNLVFQLQIQEGEPSDWQYPYGALVHEKEIADVEHIETIYEMNTKNTIGGTEYTAGIPFSNISISNVDFNKYKYLRFTCRWNDHANNWFGGSITFDLDLQTPYNSDSNYISVISNRPSNCYISDNALIFDLVGFVKVSANKNVLDVVGYKITYTGERTSYTPDNYLPYFRIEKIEGMY